MTYDAMERQTQVREFLAALRPELVDLHGECAVGYVHTGRGGESVSATAADLIIACACYEAGAVEWGRVTRAYSVHREAWAYAAADYARWLANETARTGKAA